MIGRLAIRPRDDGHLVGGDTASRLQYVVEIDSLQFLVGVQATKQQTSYNYDGDLSLNESTAVSPSVGVRYLFPSVGDAYRPFLAATYTNQFVLSTDASEPGEDGLLERHNLEESLENDTIWHLGVGVLRNLTSNVLFGIEGGLMQRSDTTVSDWTDNEWSSVTNSASTYVLLSVLIRLH